MNYTKIITETLKTVKHLIMTLPRQLNNPKVMNVQKQKKTNAMCNELVRKARPDF